LVHHITVARDCGNLPDAGRSFGLAEIAARDKIARMWDRLGHDVITGPAASDIVVVKGDRKFITGEAGEGRGHLSGLPVLSVAVKNQPDQTPVS
jgi:hypothetical protein